MKPNSKPNRDAIKSKLTELRAALGKTCGNDAGRMATLKTFVIISIAVLLSVQGGSIHFRLLWMMLDCHLGVMIL